MASIYERPGKVGTGYQLRWRDPDLGGKQDTWTFDNRAEAETWQKLLDSNGQSLAAAKTVYKKIEEAKGGITLAEAFEEHLNQLTDVGLYMMKRYRGQIRDHFAKLSELPVAAITRSDITGWVNEMKKKPGRYGRPMAAKTIANNHGLLSAALQTAVLNHHITGNPCKGIKLPKDQATEEPMRFMTQEEWGRIMGTADAYWHAFLSLLIGSGLRFNEATALTAKDFHLRAKAPYVSVTKAWKEDDSKQWYIGPPKTKKARRRVTIAPSTVEAVRGAVEAAGEGLVFQAKRGGRVRATSFYNTCWSPTLLKLGYRKPTKTDDGTMPRVHDIRHSHASWMIANGMDIFELSHRLGHESVTTTGDRYSHLLPDAQFKAADIAERALKAPAPKELEP